MDFLVTIFKGKKTLIENDNSVLETPHMKIFTVLNTQHIFTVTVLT